MPTGPASDTLRGRIRREVDRRLWSVQLDKMPRWRARLWFGLRVAYVLVQELARGELSLRAMSLVYTTLLSLVPLLALAFTVFKAFGAYTYLEPALMNALTPLGPKAGEVVGRIIGFVGNVKVGVMGAVGLALLIYTSVSLMQKIEGAFNYTWHVRYQRRLIHRYRDYLAALIVGPVLVVVAFGLTANVLKNPWVQGLLAFAPVGALYALVTSVLPYLLVIVAFTVFYVLIPNARVRWWPAIVGAVVAGALWESVGWGFTAFVVSSARYDAIYSAFASLVLFMLWVYISWLILLVGAAIAYFVQHPDYLVSGEHDFHVSNMLAERLALATMFLVGRRYYNQRQPWTLEELAHHCHVPADAMASVIERLERDGLLVRTDDEPPGLLPGTPPDTTPIRRILDAIRGRTIPPMVRMPMHPQVAKLVREVDAAVDGLLHQRTLKDLVQAGENDDSHKSGNE